MPNRPALSPTPPLDAVHLRRADTNERFVAFAFAGADLMVEAEPTGIITYATGAFRTRFGKAAESFVNAPVASLVSQSDQETLEFALTMLVQRGRLAPMMVRMADTSRTQMALAGIVLPITGRPRLCLTFARPPEQAASVLRPAGAQGFMRAMEASLRAGLCEDLYLLEVTGAAGGPTPDSAAFGQALEALVPQASASELAPGRYGVRGAGTDGAANLDGPGALQAALREQGVDAAVTAARLSLNMSGLTPRQAARALRHALNAFARDGTRGLNQAGIGTELAGYMKHAGHKADILRRVLRDGRFSLSYQPIVSLADRSVHHYEALIRPKPIPELPLANPQEFVMLIEALGLANDLDLRIATMACDHALAAGLHVGFNISGQSVQNREFRARLIRVLENHPACRAGLAMVEMTETAEIDDVDEALRTAEALRGIGVPFCLDDFGAGAADMRLLRALTPNIVKLDGSYVPGIVNGGRERAFISGMTEIARAVGAEVVAERIETEDEAAILAGLGVHYGQGWHFGRPAELPARAAKAATEGRTPERVN